MLRQDLLDGFSRCKLHQYQFNRDAGAAHGRFAHHDFRVRCYEDLGDKLPSLVYNWTSIPQAIEFATAG
jgi:hypothetical protein